MELIVLKLMLVVLTKSNSHVSKILQEVYVIGIQQTTHALMLILVINYQQLLQQIKSAEIRFQLVQQKQEVDALIVEITAVIKH